MSTRTLSTDELALPDMLSEVVKILNIQHSFKVTIRYCDRMDHQCGHCLSDQLPKLLREYRSLLNHFQQALHEFLVDVSTEYVETLPDLWELSKVDDVEEKFTNMVKYDIPILTLEWKKRSEFDCLRARLGSFILQMNERIPEMPKISEETIASVSERKADPNGVVSAESESIIVSTSTLPASEDTPLINRQECPYHAIGDVIKEIKTMQDHLELFDKCWEKLTNKIMKPLDEYLRAVRSYRWEQTNEARSVYNTAIGRLVRCRVKQWKWEDVHFRSSY
ncbi:hypothetical protein C8Q80DRAFT_1116852 [Daedaleopsis nitida]|nr:hypothetical protein C8Q80DRAFT_1116852 [Daedaleopsis nitida]